jgi:hypothetical protein
MLNTYVFCHLFIPAEMLLLNFVNNKLVFPFCIPSFSWFHLTKYFIIV